jgi:cell division protein FtsL
MESKMTDWVYYGIEKRNYGIRRKNGIGARELLRALLLLIPVAGSLVFLLWVRSEITDTGYRIQKLSQQEESLTQTREKLVVKEGVLQSPDRIDRIARGRLGMEPLRPEQVLTSGTFSNPADNSVVAMTNRN